MSVLIKGMQMPKNCTYCDSIGLNVAIGCFVMTGINGRATDCPLVEIPVPHGDLIDKEKLYNTTANLEAQALAQVEKLIHSEDISEWKRWSATLNERTAFKHDLLDAQIVIEAEKKDKI